MSINIPQSVFDLYNKYCDFMLGNNNFSRVCTVYYPPIKEKCTNCTSLGGITSNVYQGGNPAPFNFNSCEYCGGQGYREKEVTKTLRLRIHWRKRDWIKTGNIVFPDAEVQVIGSMNDLPDVLACQFISLASEEKVINKNYTLSTKPFLHGFGLTRYFVAYLEEASP